MNISLNLIIIAITAIVSFICFSNDKLKQQLIFYPYLINKEKSGYYRFLTHGFVHADWVHLLFNMITLYFFGDVVENYLNTNFSFPAGSAIYLLFYILALIVASIPSYFRYRNNQYYRSLGASGAVSAILFASIMIYPTNGICLYGLLCIPAYLFGPLYLFYSAYSARKANDNIDHNAHFTGAIFGMVFIILLVPETFSNFVQTIINLF